MRRQLWHNGSTQYRHTVGPYGPPAVRSFILRRLIRARSYRFNCAFAVRALRQAASAFAGSQYAASLHARRVAVHWQSGFHRHLQHAVRFSSAGQYNASTVSAAQIYNLFHSRRQPLIAVIAAIRLASVRPAIAATDYCCGGIDIRRSSTLQYYNPPRPIRGFPPLPPPGAGVGHYCATQASAPPLLFQATPLFRLPIRPFRSLAGISLFIAILLIISQYRSRNSTSTVIHIVSITAPYCFAPLRYSATSILLGSPILTFAAFNNG